MKINISIEVTPEEVREIFGMPNLTKVQQMVLEKISKGVESGTLDATTITQMMGPFKLGQQVMETLLNNFENVVKSSQKKT